MERKELEGLLKQIHGCTFATLDAETTPSPGIRKVTTGKRVLLFTNKSGISGYEQMVKRRLIEAGKNANDFVLSDLPWGTRIPETPLIEHKGQVYLQCIELTEGDERYFIKANGKEVDPSDLALRSSRTSQGLPLSDEVRIRCYNLEHITRIALMGAVLKVA